MKEEFEPQKIAQTLLNYPDGLISELTLWMEADGYEIEIEDEVCEGCFECGVEELDVKSEDDARKAFVLFAASYKRE